MAPAELQTLVDGVAVLAVRNEFNRSMLTQHYRQSLERALTADASAMGSGTESILRVAGIGIANFTAYGWSLGAATLGAAGIGAIALRRRAQLGRNFEVSSATTAAATVIAFGAFSTLFTLEVERIWTLIHLPVVVGVVALLRSARLDISARTAQAWGLLLLVQTVLFELFLETRW